MKIPRKRRYGATTSPIDPLPDRFPLNPAGTSVGDRLWHSMLLKQELYRRLSTEAMIGRDGNVHRSWRIPRSFLYCYSKNALRNLEARKERSEFDESTA